MPKDDYGWREIIIGFLLFMGIIFLEDVPAMIILTVLYCLIHGI